MNLSAPFVARPVATTLLTLGIGLSGILAFSKLPIAPVPQVDYPTISISAELPGASPETVASSVAEPLERHLGQIADVTEMTSQSAVGQTRITLQFDLDRDINGAARDVQAAINAARADLPSNLKSNPTYRKVNPADAPILILAMTSDTLTKGQMYDFASNVFQQQLSQINGVGQVVIGGSALPAVRVELNPQVMFKYGIGLEDVRAALASANANSPKGTIDEGLRRYQIYSDDQATKAADYVPLVIAYRNSASIRLSDVASVTDSVEDVRNLGLSNGEPSVLIILFRQPGANIIDVIDNVKAELPHLEAAMPADVNVSIAIDRSPSIRAALHDTELTLLIAIILVTVVVYLFLRDFSATLIPAIVVPVSILGTFASMYMLGYSLDILSLMALTIATGFVVDDAIVVLENISRHLETGMPRFQAALLGANEVWFTVLSISLSLLAVFIPVLLMGGILGRVFREFTLTLSFAVVISLVVSLTATPMMCSLFLRSRPSATERGRVILFESILAAYGRSLGWALRHSWLVIVAFLGAIALNILLFIVVPKGFFPEEDTGEMYGLLIADPSASFQMMSQKLRALMAIVQQDPAVQNIVGFTGATSGFGASSNSGSVIVSLKPRSQRPSIDEVTARLRPKLAQVPAGRLYLVAAQDIRAGGRQSNSLYQYTLMSDDETALSKWTPRLVAALDHSSVLTDVSSDQQQRGLESELVIDRDMASRLGITPAQIDNTLYDAFGQRQVSVIYSAINQYHVVMEIDPQYTQYPASLRDIYVAASGGGASGTAQTNAPVGDVAVLAKAAASQTASASIVAAANANNNAARNAATNALADVGKGSASSGAAVSTAMETMIPLAAVSHYNAGSTPLSISHQGLFVASTISFNLLPGVSLGDAAAEIDAAVRHIRMPVSIHGSLAGTAKVFQQSLGNEPVLIFAAIVTVYILLGILYESYIHPITILSTLPSAGVGAILALMMFQTEFSIIALIGVILLIGIVMKNAIMMVDFAIDAKRAQHLSSYDAIYQACILRFRPIMMTTAAALLGAVPLALSFGNGGEIRRPLGISIMGGLLMSQLLTLYTTPVVYLYMDRFGQWSRRRRVFGTPAAG